MHKLSQRSNVETLKPLNVLLVVSSYLPNIGGLETVTSRLARELQQRGHNVLVLTQRYPRVLAAAEAIDGVRVRRLLFLIPRWRDLSTGRFDLFLAGLFYFPASLFRLVWQIARAKPDVVNLHFVGAPAFFLLIARVFLRFRFVVSLHGDDVQGLPRGTWFDHWIFRATLRYADAVTACSRFLLDQAQRIEPTVTRKAHVIYNGIDLSDLSPNPFPAREGEQRVELLSVGRLVPKKGFDILLRALSQCHQAGHRMRLVLIGDGPERHSLKALTRELGLDDWIDFRGPQKHDEVVRAMASSRLVVVPSRQEPFGFVALEALALGKPVIASKVGGLPEVLADADAMLVLPDNLTELANALTQMLERLEREPAFGARNRELAARFSLERMVTEYLHLYLDGKAQ